MDGTERRATLIALVQRLLNGVPEHEADHLMDALQTQVLDPSITNDIFWPDREMTAEEIVERALAYVPRVAGERV